CFSSVKPSISGIMASSTMSCTEMDGFTLLKHLKAEQRWQMLPIIMLTALTSMKDKLQAITIGVDDYLTKPFEPEELVARVRNVLQNASLRQQQVAAVGAMAWREDEATESADLKWLRELQEIAFRNITEPNFNVLQLATEMNISERQLSRKLKQVIGMTPGNYLNEVRLQKARQLLEAKACRTIAEVAYQVGFSTPRYFSTIFKKRFGKAPSTYLREGN
ncbi:MAG: helix-turn-helix domain-containing protein, partial [Bacteroidota bacterium]